MKRCETKRSKKKAIETEREPPLVPASFLCMKNVMYNLISVLETVITNPMPPNRWVVQEALSGVALAATEKAALALLAEGVRRCQLLQPSPRYPSTAAAPALGDGWNFDDYDDEEGVTEESRMDLATEVMRLRARLEALRCLLETCWMAEQAQGRGFDVDRLREFLLLEGGDYPRGGKGCFRSRLLARRWEEGGCQREVLKKGLERFATMSEASALGVLFDRHPRETMPLRMETLR